jgi:hypothetical protein
MASVTARAHRRRANENLFIGLLLVGAAAPWLANFTITLTFPPLPAADVALPYLLYSISALLSFSFVSRSIRETNAANSRDGVAKSRAPQL